jgi:hypothetical protein
MPAPSPRLAARPPRDPHHPRRRLRPQRHRARQAHADPLGDQAAAVRHALSGLGAERRHLGRGHRGQPAGVRDRRPRRRALPDGTRLRADALAGGALGAAAAVDVPRRRAALRRRPAARAERGAGALQGARADTGGGGGAGVLPDRRQPAHPAGAAPRRARASGGRPGEVLSIRALDSSTGSSPISTRPARLWRSPPTPRSRRPAWASSR